MRCCDSKPDTIDGIKVYGHDELTIFVSPRGKPVFKLRTMPIVSPHELAKKLEGHFGTTVSVASGWGLGPQLWSWMSRWKSDLLLLSHQETCSPPSPACNLLQLVFPKHKNLLLWVIRDGPKRLGVHWGLRFLFHGESPVELGLSSSWR